MKVRKLKYPANFSHNIMNYKKIKDCEILKEVYIFSRQLTTKKRIKSLCKNP